MHAVSDIISGTQGIKYSYGHTQSYWATRPYGVGSESFAHFFGASVSGNKEKVDLYKKIYPKSFEMFEEMLGVDNE